MVGVDGSTADNEGPPSEQQGTVLPPTPGSDTDCAVMDLSMKPSVPGSKVKDNDITSASRKVSQNGGERSSVTSRRQQGLNNTTPAHAPRPAHDHSSARPSVAATTPTPESAGSRQHPRPAHDHSQSKAGGGGRTSSSGKSKTSKDLPERSSANKHALSSDSGRTFTLLIYFTRLQSSEFQLVLSNFTSLKCCKFVTKIRFVGSIFIHK
jgi:hypothetical protein